MRAAVALSLTIVMGLAALPGAAAAQSWPSKPVKIISPFAAGGPTDTLARPVAEHLGKVLGQPFTIENRPGAGTTLGAQAAAKSDPDGYTLFFGTNSAFSIGPTLYARAGYTAASFAPIILVAETPMVLIASNKTGVASVADLVAAVRKAPEAFSFASVGVATTTHLLGERFNQIAGLKMAHVPYRGSAPAMNDIIGGQIQVFFDAMSSALPNFRAGNLKMLMMLHRERNRHAPEVPTSAEAGFPQFVASFWGGMAAPAGTPQAIIDRLNREVNDLLKTPELIKLLDNVNFIPVGGTPQAFMDHILRETAVWKEVGEKAGVRIE